jgi:hypothetical protein
MFKRALESILTGLSFLIATLVGALFAVFMFVTYFIPKRDKDRRAAEQKEADRRANEIKEILKKEHEKRAADAAKSIAAVEQKAEAAKAQDSVALANELLAEGEK